MPGDCSSLCAGDQLLCNLLAQNSVAQSDSDLSSQRVCGLELGHSSGGSGSGPLGRRARDVGNGVGLRRRRCSWGWRHGPSARPLPPRACSLPPTALSEALLAAEPGRLSAAWAALICSQDLVSKAHTCASGPTFTPAPEMSLQPSFSEACPVGTVTSSRATTLVPGTSRAGVRRLAL